MAYTAGQKLRASDLNPGAWNDLTLNNSWTNFDTDNPAVYRLSALGDRVEIIGKITGGTNTSGTAVATLPAGFRPPSEQGIVAVTNTGIALNLDVETDGTIKISNVNTAPTVILINGSIVVDFS